MRSVEQLAEQQRARLDELQAGHLALEAALQALLVGSEEAAKEALKYKSPKSVAVRPAEAAPVHDERRDRAVRFQSSMQRSDSAPAIRSADPASRRGGEYITKDETPQKAKAFRPVWDLPPGAGDALTPPKLAIQDHIQGGSAQGDMPGMHGHNKDEDVQDGLPRGMGHGKRHLRGVTDHFVGHGTAVGDGPGAHGNPNDYGRALGNRHRHILVESHIESGVGHDDTEAPGSHGWLGEGRKHFPGKEQELFQGCVSLDKTPSNRRHYARARDQREHWRLGYDVDAPPDKEIRYGHAREEGFEGGLERFIGHGKRHRPEWQQIEHQTFGADLGSDDGEHGRAWQPVGGEDHIMPGCGQTTCWENDQVEQGKRHFGVKDHICAGASADDPAGSHGQSKDDMFQGGLPRGIGHGKQHILVKDHFRGGMAPVGDVPGSHGHQRSDFFQDGLERGIGHGKRHITSGLAQYQSEAEMTPAVTYSSAPRSLPQREEGPAAGMASRYCAPPNPGRLARPQMW